MMAQISFLDSLRKPPFCMEGLEAEKKKKDLARRHKKIHIGYIRRYTELKLQYSQLNNLIKNGR
jgi:hypothetical protein